MLFNYSFPHALDYSIHDTWNVHFTSKTYFIAVRSLGRAKTVRAYALLTKSPFRAYALLTKSPFRAYALLTKSPFRACSVSALFGMPEWLWLMIRLCAGENILCLSYRVCSFIYLPFIQHKNLCRDCESLFSSKYHTPVPWSVCQYLSMSLSLSILCLYLCSTDLRSLYLSLPTNQHLTPTTPKNFLFYYFIKFPEDK